MTLKAGLHIQTILSLCTNLLLWCYLYTDNVVRYRLWSRRLNLSQRKKKGGRGERRGRRKDLQQRLPAAENPGAAKREPLNQTFLHSRARSNISQFVSLENLNYINLVEAGIWRLQNCKMLGREIARYFFIAHLSFKIRQGPDPGLCPEWKTIWRALKNLCSFRRRMRERASWEALLALEPLSLYYLHNIS